MKIKMPFNFKFPFTDSKRSFSSFVAEEAIRFSNTKSRYADPQDFERYVERVRVSNEKKYVPAMRFRSIKSDTVRCGMQCFELCGKNCDRTILYIHGGAYMEQPLLFHWLFLDKLAKESNARIIVPIYPQAPVHDYREAFQMMLELYLEIQREDKDLILMGDSAGGGFSLGLSMELRRMALAQPARMILICPWVDATMSNPDIDKQEELDPMLSKYGLLKAAQMWAGPTELNDFKISPLYGDLTNLAPMTVFVGTHELFLPDIRLFRKKAEECGAPISYYEYPEMNHVFPMFPVPEAREALTIIIVAVRSIPKE